MLGDLWRLYIVSLCQRIFFSDLACLSTMQCFEERYISFSLLLSLYHLLFSLCHIFVCFDNYDFSVDKVIICH